MLEVVPVISSAQYACEMIFSCSVGVLIVICILFFALGSLPCLCPARSHYGLYCLPLWSFTPFWPTKLLVFITRAQAVQHAHSLHSCTDLLKSGGRFRDSQQMSFCGPVTVHKYNLPAPFIATQMFAINWDTDPEANFVEYAHEQTVWRTCFDAVSPHIQL